MSSTKPTNPLFALVDCNNFYVSCERVFRPKLHKKPVAVLSNNDGCVVARSKELKALGIPMGVPVFQIADLIKKHQIITCSSNYTLYGDMSKRVMETLAQFSPDLQVYSIDEAFLLVPVENAETHCKMIRRAVGQHTGIPVSIGIAPTKTLAKIANHIAKSDPQADGVFRMDDPAMLETILRQLPVKEIWGIGHQLAAFLNNNNIQTAWELRHADDVWVRKHMSVVGLRTVWELRGISCLKLEEIAPKKKSIICSKSFGRPVTLWEEAAEGISAYTVRAAEKLRRQKSLTSYLGVFIESTRSYENGFYSNHAHCTLPQPTAYTPLLIHYAKMMLKKIFRPGIPYIKVGIMLDGIVPQDCFQMDLFCVDKTEHAKQQDLMQLIDKANEKFGRKVLWLAAEGIQQPWKMKQQKRSPRYTTQWDEILKICI